MNARIPKWLWAIAILWHLGVAVPFWQYSRPAPYFDVHGDVYRGWPLVFGLDQGDVIGDEWLFMTTYFRPGAFALDTGLAVLCGLPVSLTVLLLARRHSRNAATTAVELSPTGKAGQT